MAVITDTNIAEKYISDAKIGSEIFKGISSDKEINAKILKELEDDDSTIEDILTKKISDRQTKIDEFKKTLPTFDKTKFSGLVDYVELPRIISKSNPERNRFKQLNNDENLLITIPGDINNGLYVYKLNETLGQLEKIFELPKIVKKEDVRQMQNFELFDITWNYKENKYQIFWVSAVDQKIRSAYITSSKYMGDIFVITNNTSVKGGCLRANMNSGGDIVVFTSAKASDNYFYGIFVSKERSLSSWQTTDLLTKSGNNHDYPAKGNVQIVEGDFFFVFSNSVNRLYFVKITNSENQLISSTETTTGNFDNPTCQMYKIYDSVSKLNDYYIVATVENDKPRVMKVQNDLSVIAMTKMPNCASITSPYVFTSDGIAQLPNRFTRNFGEQWTENQLATLIGTSNIESQKYIIIRKANSHFYLVNIKNIVAYNKILKTK